MSEANEQKTDGAYADEIIEGHSYDGIQEYDNPMPLWWKAVFALTVIWSPIYVGAIELGFIDTYQEALHAEDVYWDERIAELKKDQPELTPERIKTEMTNPARVEEGKTVYAANCAACHGDNGEGLIGPNLTDKFWLHGGDVNSIYDTIDKGVLDKGMPAWGSTLGAENVLNVGSFINSIRNTDVKGKAPQGEPYVGDGGEEAGDAAEGDAAGAEAGGDDAEKADDQAEAEDEAGADEADDSADEPAAEKK